MSRVIYDTCETCLQGTLPMAQKILAQEWERLKTRTDLEVCINPVINPLHMSLYVFHCEGRQETLFTTTNQLCCCSSG